MFPQRYLAAVKAAAYALFEQHGELGEEPETFDTFADAGARLAELRGTADLAVVSGSFEWPGEARQALIVTLTPIGGEAARRFTLCTRGESVAQLAGVLNRRQPARRLL